MRRGILERDSELSALANAIREAAERHGSVVLVMGEAGKPRDAHTSALRRWRKARNRTICSPH